MSRKDQPDPVLARLSPRKARQLTDLRAAHHGARLQYKAIADRQDWRSRRRAVTLEAIMESYARAARELVGTP